MSNQTKPTDAQSTMTEPAKPAKRKLTGFDYYLMALEEEGVPFQQVAGEIDTLITKYGEVTGLPPFQDGTIFVVSGLVRAAVPHRHDVWQPGELLRNEAGQVIGCVGLSQ